MQYTPVITYGLILINVLFSWQGLRNKAFFDRFSYDVDKVLISGKYHTLITSAFLHIGWGHLIFNMISLYLFGNILELYLGAMPFLIVYFAGLLGGKLLSLFIHRHHGDYGSVGASGAICGVIFAAIALIPGMTVSPFGLYIPIPGWLFGLVYILYSIYGIRSKTDNIGHESHLGGALAGMFTAIAFQPSAIFNNYSTIAIICFPAVIIIYIIITRPYVLLIDNLYFKQHLHNATIDDRYNLGKSTEAKEIDRILEKIHQRGINSLNKSEKEKLDKYSGSRN